ncbi:uncharacterized protein LOC131150905 [Malania oleifera]|uniref:uncharacterized protein LOC131150905 n=1 Tax=Malania oleifera TaxID=397392 RepID=UPI0025AEBE50|nr:uncharacterized protein LOC131150905 [Malania oleifera]
MASGSSGRTNSGAKGFDFGTDDILCSYEDYGAQESSNGSHSDPAIGASAGKEFHKNRISRSSLFPTSTYGPQEDSLNQDVICTVEKTMKKYADNLMRFLEGISSRLSQLELYCYNLDKSIAEMRSDLVRDHGEADTKLKSVEKHLQEVHRSVQILRDKQELAEAQKELAKLQLAQKESSSASHSQHSEERGTPTASDSQRSDNASDMSNQQLALALPHQVAPQPSLPPRPIEQQQPVAPPSQAPVQNVTQPQAYYLPPTTQLPAQTQHPQGQYLSSDPQYRTPQLQDISRVAPQPAQSQVSQATQVHQLPQYQQPWAQQMPQQVQPPQQPSMQPQIRPQSTSVYPPYPSQPANPSLPETLPISMPMQVPYSGISQPGASRADVMPYGYGGVGRTVQQQQQPSPLPQHVKGNFAGQPGDGYSATGPHPALSHGNAYVMYDTEGGRAHHPQQSPPFSQGGYPPSNVSLQNPQPTTSANLMSRNPSTQILRNHPYTELIDKLVSMGYRGDHVVGAIQRMEETGQPVDFNSVLDRLNVLSSGGSQRGW